MEEQRFRRDRRQLFLQAPQVVRAVHLLFVLPAEDEWAEAEVLGQHPVEVLQQVGRAFEQEPHASFAGQKDG